MPDDSVRDAQLSALKQQMKIMQVCSHCTRYMYVGYCIVGNFTGILIFAVFAVVLRA